LESAGFLVAPPSKIRGFLTRSGVGTLAGLRQGAVSDPAPRETMAQAPRQPRPPQAA
jgi:hypothetical protein